MLIESVAGLLLVRRRMVALRFGSAMGEPLFGGVVFGFAACGTLARDPQIDNFSHAFEPQCPVISIPRQLRRYGGGVCA
jgi:hypothetical protein